MQRLPRVSRVQRLRGMRRLLLLSRPMVVVRLLLVERASQEPCGPSSSHLVLERRVLFDRLWSRSEAGPGRAHQG
jgi:hypothetical protein